MTPVVRTGAPGRANPISYAVSGPGGSGTRDLVLVHGWCCDGSLMAPLRERLEQTHRVVTLDLRGHGRSQDVAEDGSIGVGRGRWGEDLPVPTGTVATSVAEFAQDVVVVCEAAGLRDPVVIGHSMGALVALDTLVRADSPLRRVPRRPAHPVGAVLLDPAPLAHERSKADWAERAAAIRRDHTGDLRRAFARSLVLDTDRAGYDRVVEVMAATHPEVAAGGARAMATFDGAGALGNLASPMLVIQAAHAERGLEQLVPDRRLLTLGRTVGSGHFQQLEVPDQLVPMIGRWLEVALG
ncbi:alpha/beta fold hydrolase [Ornithinimicrobium cavernae]|uniref:alpha/beta fold hydrolase n=1 Tax=Ornithinimicrobium cavernae TaxID=2666047 RepID=UPI00137AFE30|nr:alpha/beta hydrolase [Ornithinimicrobium cavernae]